jgi:Tfp pilus assembly protein PilF
LANLIVKGKKYDDAKKIFQLVLNVSPNNATALNNMGVIAFVCNKFKEAEEYFQKVLTFEPSNEDANINLMQLRAQNS